MKYLLKAWQTFKVSLYPADQFGTVKLFLYVELTSLIILPTYAKCLVIGKLCRFLLVDLITFVYNCRNLCEMQNMKIDVKETEYVSFCCWGMLLLECFKSKNIILSERLYSQSHCSS